MRRALLVPVLLALVLGIAVVIRRRDPESVRESPPGPDPSAPSVSSEPAEPPPTPAAAPDPPERPAPPKVDLRSAFQALIDALRSGDRDRIREALADLEGLLIPEPVPDEENAALVYQKAFKKLSEFSEEEKEIIKLLDDGGQLTLEQREVLRKLLEKNQEAIALLREAAERPKCRFPVDYEKGFEAELPHIAPLIRAARLLRVASQFGGAGQEGALMHPSLKLADALAGEPLFVSQLVRSVCHGQTAAVLESGLGGATSEAVLRGLFEGIDPGFIRDGLEQSLYFELYSGAKLVTQEKIPDTFFTLNGLRRPDDPLSAQDLAYYAETLQEYASLAGRPYYEVMQELEQLERAKVDGAPWYAQYTRMLLPAMTRAAERQAETEAALGASKIAAAVKLYELREGAYPTRLSDLKSVFPDLPPDPFTGKAFAYRREGSGFVIYSMGTDGADGGGSAEHDVVFRSPR